ncbi:MAG: Integrase catalytic region [Candidatus Saganbacteria bacterium]|uniref:Integrase catalytic region n=1 Tax=Candidatus Saganbacteria bacterium TaxID=2575572 RepID=A0A833KZU9_UNCSA|nr:MAG: Integrase catalytic region [Candidatus Saganbacteria bacterium]
MNDNHAQLSLRQQCELLDLNRSSYYYDPAPESEYNLQLMSLIDEQYTKTPFYGSPKITAWLKRMDYVVNIKRVKRLMRKMGIAAIYPGPNLSKRNQSHKIYPYLLKSLDITRENQVWATDITYVRLKNGFLYLVAIIDWWSRYVLAWELSNTLDSHFCIKALKEALLKYGKPDIFNSDQGSQFTDADFIEILLEHGVQISMDSKGRVFDNIFVERLWRSVKYENIYLNNYDGVLETYCGLKRYFEFYNDERLHQSLKYKTPAEIYFAIKPQKEVVSIKKTSHWHAHSCVFRS